MHHSSPIMDPYAYTKYDSAKRAKIMEVVSSQGHEGVVLDPDWLKLHNIKLDFEARKGRQGAMELCPVIKQLDTSKPAYIGPDPNASFVRTIIPNAACNPKYLSPKRIALEAGEYPLSATSKQRILVDPKNDSEDYGKRAIIVIKEWQNRAVSFLAKNPHLHDLVSPVTGKPATDIEIAAILRNKSDTSFRPMVDESQCEDGDVGSMFLHNRPFKTRGRGKGEPLTSLDPATETTLKHPNFAGEVEAVFTTVIKDAAYGLKLKPIVVVMPDGRTISYGEGIFDGAIGSFRVSFGPLHVRKDGRNSQMTFTHYCDRVTLITNGPDPEPSAGSNFMAMFNKEPASRAGSPVACASANDTNESNAAIAEVSEAETVIEDDDVESVVRDDQDIESEQPGVVTDSGSVPQQSSASNDKKRKRLLKLGKKSKRRNRPDTEDA